MLPRSSTPSISFSFLSRRLHLCYMSTCFARPDGSFLNLSCSQRSSEFGSIEGSMPPFQDASFLCKLGSSVIPFPFAKLITIFVIWAIFSCISGVHFQALPFSRSFHLPCPIWRPQIPFRSCDSKSLEMFKNPTQLGLLGAIFLVISSLKIFDTLWQNRKGFFLKKKVLLCKTRHMRMSACILTT